MSKKHNTVKHTAAPGYHQHSCALPSQSEHKLD